MPIEPLTAQFCQLAYCELGKRKTDYYDTVTKGFVLECRASGGKSYYLRFQDEHGRQKQHRIAGYGDISFHKARKEAERLKSQIVLGGDPAAAKEERKAVPTYGELAVQHLAHAKPYQRAYSTTAMYMNNHIVPRWGKVRLTDIRQQDVAAWLAQKSAEGLAPATVEKIRVIFGRSFELATQWGMAGSGKNPTRGIPRKPINNARQRFLTSAEVDRLLHALDHSGNAQLKSIVQLLLLTGCRKAELLKAQWQHVDLERRAWYIPTTKTGKPRYVPLSQAAVDVISTLPRWTGCPWLLPNPATRNPYTCIKHRWDTVRKAAGLSDVRLHDLRHAAASFMINAGVDLFAVGRVLGHADHKSTMRYAHLANDTLLAAVEAGAQKMKI